FDESVRVHGQQYIFKNGDWVQSNIKLDMKGCDFLQLFLRLFKNLQRYFPDPICPLPVGEYFINNTVITSENWPNYLISGLSRFDMIFEKDGKVVGGVIPVMNLIEKHI
ncbi:hypothetical protein KR067_003367, partial [Drosophila pandora]